jgi:hypothetical protein
MKTPASGPQRESVPALVLVLALAWAWRPAPRAREARDDKLARPAEGSHRNLLDTQ